MKLYYSPGACSFASHIALNEAGAKYETIKTDLKNKTEEWNKMNPKGYVPALMTDKGLLTEGAAILQFIGDQFPEKNLIPKAGTWERYRAVEMLNFIATEVHKSFSPLFGADSMVTNPEGNTQLKTAVKEKLFKRFGNLEEMLKGKEFLMGNQFTVCDAYLYTVLNWTKPMKIDMSKWPILMGYVEKIQGRPSVQAALKAEAN